ncbi:Gfo/Idh/MocA family protein [Jiangella anatolica]|nr:Gfo/Idh/MocA family oxidoreductase [Jiangella anatolica]
MVRFATIGAGFQTEQSILPSLRFTDLELVAVCDLDEERARVVGSRHGALRTYTDYQKMLASEEIDAVSVVGPPELHHEAGLAVLESGRHLFVEKPPAPDLAKARQIQAAAASRGLQVMVGFMKRHAHAYVRARELSTRPGFGRRTMLRLNYSHVHYASLREHAIFMTVHGLDLARYFMGDVAGGSVAKREIDGNYVIALLVQHEDGGFSQITLSTHEPRVQESVELVGESALIQVTNLTELRYHPRASTWEDVQSTDESMVSLWYPEFAIPIEYTSNHVLQGYAGQLRHFANALAAGEAVSPNIDDGVEAMRLAEALCDAPDGITPLRLRD